MCVFIATKTIQNFILNHNLILNSKQYLQMDRTVMGKKLVMTLVNIFTHYVKSTFLFSFNTLYASATCIYSKYSVILPYGAHTLKIFHNNTN